MAEHPPTGDEPVVPAAAGSTDSSEVESQPAPEPSNSGSIDLEQGQKFRPVVPPPAEVIDLDEVGRQAALGPGKPPDTVVVSYSDKIRGRIAGALIGLVALVVFASFVTLWAGLVFRNINYENLKDLLTIVFGPLIALASAAVGYYFGGKDKEK